MKHGHQQRLGARVGAVLVAALLGGTGCTLKGTQGNGDDCVQDNQCVSPLRCLPRPGDGRKFCTYLDPVDVLVPDIVDVPRADTPDVPSMDAPSDTSTNDSGGMMDTGPADSGTVMDAASDTSSNDAGSAMDSASSDVPNG